MAAFFYAGHFSDKRGDLSSEQKGYCLFTVDDIVLQKNPFKNRYVFKGKIKLFQSDKGHEYYGIPCTVRPPKAEQRPLASSDFFFRAHLTKTEDGGVLLEPKGAWIKVQNTYSLAEIRLYCKKAFRSFIRKKISHTKGAEFLYSLCSGEIESQLMQNDFSRLGLQHILAVSGFHFSIIALFAGALLQRALPKKWASIALFILLSLYFCLLSSSPSILRAYLAATVALLGSMLGRKPCALNTLGICLLCELFIDPFVLFHIGFQLSFLCTAALLILNPVIKQLTRPLFPAKQKAAIITLPSLDKMYYFISRFLHEGLSASLSVHLVSIPVCLYYGSNFPLLSFIYNLFFPFLIALCMGLFLSGLLLMIIPPIGSYVLEVSGNITGMLLKITEHPPLKLELGLFCSSLSACFIICYLLGVFVLFSWQKQKRQNFL